MMTLIFDWDGTLHDTLHLYGRAFRLAYEELVELGYAPPRHYSDEEVSVYLGISAPDMWNTFMPRLPQEVKQAASDRIGNEMVRLIGMAGFVVESCREIPGCVQRCQMSVNN